MLLFYAPIDMVFKLFIINVVLKYKWLSGAPNVFKLNMIKNNNKNKFSINQFEERELKGDVYFDLS